MNNRMAGPDHSLNAPLNKDSNSEWQDWLVDATSQEDLEESQEYKFRKAMLINALSVLNDREKSYFSGKKTFETQVT